MSGKFIFIYGGVLSSLGKGIASSSIALLLESMGLKVAMMKLDPYLNIDPGTMSPFQHGEVYVTDDGAETDLDLGHYYRFTNSPLSKLSNTTSGQIYYSVIEKERRGEYLGKTVQVIPHITDEIKKQILACSEQQTGIDVTIVEVGGTVGDIESGPFLEAIRQFYYEREGRCLNIYLSYVPFVSSAGEVKTKPTQHSVQLAQRSGIFADLIFCRAEKKLSKEIKDKISLFCSVPPSAVFDVIDVENSIYEVPLNFQEDGLDHILAEKLKLKKKSADLSEWKRMVDTVIHPKNEVHIALIGKYVQHADAYKSVLEALLHGGIAHQTKVHTHPIDSETLSSEKSFLKQMEGFDGALVPGGFGERGIEGKILAASVCRKHKIPFFGICLGMQILVIEYTRHVLKLAKANSSEMDEETPYPVISLLAEQKSIKNLGGTMRLGAYKCKLTPSSLAGSAYGRKVISERHRHRFELNNEYREALEKAGLRITGVNPETGLAEVVEVSDHPWMIGVQFHPELKSRPMQPHPLFVSFIGATLKSKKAIYG